MKKNTIYLSILSTVLVGMVIFSNLKNPEAEAADCPAVNLKNIPSGFVGMHIISNTAPLQQGVRLNWKDPSETKPTSVTILRKKLGSSFEEIGTVAGGVGSYLDTTIAPKTSSYFYVLKNTYFCGSTNFSNYIEVPLLIQRDNSEPRATLLTSTPQAPVLGKEDPLIILFRDLESGVNPTSIQVQQDGKTISTGKTAGNTQSLLWFYYPSKTGAPSGTGSTLSLKATNSNTLNLPGQDTEKTFSVKENSNVVRFGGPTFGSLLAPNKKLTLSWKARAALTSETYLLSVSYDLGQSWETVDSFDKSKNTLVMNIPSDTLPKLKEGRRESLLLFRIQLLSKDNTEISHDILPLFLGNVEVSIERMIQTIFFPSGTFKVFDAYSNKPVSFPIANDTLTEVQKKWTFTDQIQSVETILPQGYYSIKATLNSYTFPIYTPEDHDGIFYFSNNSIKVPLLSEPTLHYETDRTGIDEDTLSIIESRTEPLSKYPYVFPEPPSNENTQSNVNLNTNQTTEPAPELPPLEIKTSYCNTSILLCKNDTYTASNGESITLYADALQKVFYSTNATVESEEKSLIGIPSVPKFYSFFVDALYRIDIPSSVIQASFQSGQSVPLFTVEKNRTKGTYTFLSSGTIKELASIQGEFLYIKKPQACREQFSVEEKKNSVPYFSLCNKNTELTTFFTFNVPSTLSTTLSPTSTPQLTEWYTPYMELFKRYGIFQYSEDAISPHTYITRGELAHLLAKTIHIPPTTYKNTYVDLPSTHTYSHDLLALTEAGIMEGEEREEGRVIRPDSPVLRAEALKMIMASTRVKTKTTAGTLTPVVPFIDVLLIHWYYPYMETAYNLGIIEGYPTVEGKREVRPGSFVTRAEAAKLIITSLLIKIDQ